MTAVSVRVCGDCGCPLVPSGTPTVQGVRRHAGRGRCGLCRYRRLRDGTWADVPRPTRANTEVVEDYLLLRQTGLSQREIADRIGMTLPAMDRAICRARARGVSV